MQRALVLVLVFASAPVSAQNAPEAERLFLEGRELLANGKPEEACKKFEQSLAKDPRQTGVLMNLGLCNARSGKIATALKLYQEAFDRSVEANNTTSRDAAQDEIDKLAPKVPVVAISRAGAPLPDEKLVIDDVVIPNDRAEVRLDPGTHVLVLTAPGRVEYEHRIALEVGAHESVKLPVLEVPKAKVVTRRMSARRLGGMVATFGGAATLLAGAGVIYYAKHDYDGLFEGSTPHCGQYKLADGTPVCDDFGHTRSARDRNLVTTGAVIGVVGVVAAATGVALWFTAPRDTLVQPTASATSVGIVVGGRF